MSSTLHLGGDRCESGPGTLGELLYADRAKVRVSEETWVALVQSIAARDQRALYALYERTHRIVFTLIMRITHNRQTAEELTLDTFLGVWQRAAKYEVTGGSVVGWIMNQARSRAMDQLRFEQRKKRVNPYAGDQSTPTAAPGPQEAAEQTEHGRLLRTALTALTPQEREAIETAFFFELTYRDVAERLHQPLGTVKARIRSGLGKLRKALAEGRMDL